MFVQALHFFVDCQQKGWVDALPRVRFTIMNTKNEPTGFTLFELRMGRNLWLIPSLVPRMANTDKDTNAQEIIQRFELGCNEARDALISVKTKQAHYANQHRQPENNYADGDYVMLSTLRRQRNYMQNGDGRTEIHAATLGWKIPSNCCTPRVLNVSH